VRVAWVSVSGACSRAGKTALVETLLRSLPERSAVAVKFTTTDDVFERCPRGTPCVVCDIAVPFRLVQDERTLREPGTDTDRLAQAGAARVLWAIAKQAAVRPAWQAVRRAVSGAAWVVMEGSTIVDLASPELHLFVAHPFLSPRRWKQTTAALVPRADAVIVNHAEGETRAPSGEVMDALRALRGRDDLLVADVTRPLGAWAPPLLSRLTALAGGRQE
jgi:hypothetical protein